MVRAAKSSSSSSGSSPRKRKPCSAKQLAANRANAQKSTGPRTAGGRESSRMNALKHGLRCRAVLLPGESRAAFDTFAEPIYRDLKPKGFVQEMLAQRVAALAWAIRRLPRVAKSLVEAGEKRRFDLWFRRRGLDMKHFAECTAELRGEIAPKSWEQWQDVADKELLVAAGQGNPAPDELEAADLVADTCVSDTAFDGLLKLQEQERRTWAAMLSTIRALERRQKVGGCAGEQAEDEMASAVNPPAPNEPISVETPAPDAQARRDAQVVSRNDDGATEAPAEPPVDANPACDSVARNEPVCSPPAQAPAASAGTGGLTEPPTPVAIAPPRPDEARAEIDKPPSPVSLCET